MQSFEVFIDHENRLVRITTYGKLYQKDGEQIITVARKTASEHSYNVLYDMRKATTIVSFSSWFSLPRDLDVLKKIETRFVKAAILASPDDKSIEDYKFYQTVAENLGLRVGVFFEENEALAWLSKNIVKN